LALSKEYYIRRLDEKSTILIKEEKQEDTTFSEAVASPATPFEHDDINDISNPSSSSSPAVA